MNRIYNNRTYAIIPTAKVVLHTKADVARGRKSLNSDFLIWDEPWDPAILAKMKLDKDIKLLTHKQALELTKTGLWLAASVL